MAKNRQSELPRCVYYRHGAYWLVKANRWIRLGTELAEALAEYARRVKPKAGDSRLTMPALIDTAFPVIFNKLADNTRKQYRIAANQLAEIFGEFEPHQILPRHVAKMKRDYRPAMANHLIKVLRGIFAYALDEQLVDSNPVVGIKKHADSERERLLSPDEFSAIRAHADRRLQLIMDLWFQTGQRVNDVLNIRRADLQDEGIYFRQQKTEARLIVRWTPALRATVEAAKALNGNVAGLTLFIGHGGKAPAYRTILRHWQAACKAAGVEDAQMRDLRAMSLTQAQAEGLDPTKLAGHRNPQITQRYLRSKQVPVVDGPAALRRKG